MDPSLRKARAIAEAGYVYLFPLVANYCLMYLEAIDPSSPIFGGGFGRWTHHRQAVSHHSDVASTHVTVLASSAWIDVRAEPWVISIPALVGDRTTRVTDLWGFVVSGSEWLGPADEPVAVADRAADDAVAAEVAAVVRAETPFVRLQVLAYYGEDVDPGSTREFQTSFRLRPLSAWSNHAPVPAAPDVAWWPAGADTLTTTAFWPTATFALGLTTRYDEDRGILDRLAEIGVSIGARWDEHDLPGDLLEAIDEGMDDALTALMRAERELGDDTPTRRSRPATDRDYFGRAAAVLRSLPLVGLLGTPGHRR